MRLEVSSRHLVLVGLNYTPRRGTSDKNFWSALVPKVAENLDRVTVISVRPETIGRETMRVGGCELETRYIDPALFAPGGVIQIGGRRSTPRGGSYRRTIGLIEKQLVVRRIVSELATILGDRPAQAVHLMDNFGPGNRLIARAVRKHGARLSVTSIAYERRGRRLYDRFLQLSYASRDLRVVALSHRLRARLRDLGVSAEAITHIPWGVAPGHVALSGDRDEARRKAGIPPQVPVFLWAGFIQQVREADFELAYKLATESRARGLEATFVFAFKPETFRPSYGPLDRPDAGVRVMPTAPEEFAAVVAASDALFSPIFDRDCIVAPPLTWIEAMAAGLPVLTTDVPGAEELIDVGKTGYLASDEEQLIERLFLLADDHTRMTEACRAKVEADYNLDDIGQAYLAFWFRETV